MGAIEWMKSKATDSMREIDDGAKMQILSKTFKGRLPYRMRQEISSFNTVSGYNESTGNEFCERIIEIRDHNGKYIETRYVYEEYVKLG